MTDDRHNMRIDIYHGTCVPDIHTDSVPDREHLCMYRLWTRDDHG